MSQEISGGRRVLYYLGFVLMGIGLLLFLSVFLTGALSAMKGPGAMLSEHGSTEPLRAISGMALMIFGGFLRVLGSRGLAGSGVVLDPRQAREDLEPYTRMAGGMLHDALEETDLARNHPAEPVVMVRCPGCRTLNEESAKFCKECGQRL